MVKSKDDLMASIKAVIGEDATDESLSLLEDVSDTFDSFSQPPTEDWKAKYEENDAMWRQKYRDRFFGEVEEHDDDFTPSGRTEKRTFEDLFN